MPEAWDTRVQAWHRPEQSPEALGELVILPLPLPANLSPGSELYSPGWDSVFY